MIKSIYIFCTILFFAPLNLFSQFGKYEIKEDKKGRLQFVDSKTNEVKYDKCLEISSIDGQFSETDESYKNYALIKLKRDFVIFDFIKGKEIERIPKVDQVKFYEIRDLYDKESMMSDAKKKVIKGEITSKSIRTNNHNFLLNVNSGKTVGLLPYLVDYRYDKYRTYLIFEIFDYSVLKTENFDSVFPALSKMYQLSDGSFIGKMRENEHFGVVDHNMNQILPFKYCQIGNFGNQLFTVVNTAGKVGILNRQGEVLVPFEYDCFDKGWWPCECNQIAKKITDGIFQLSKKEQGYSVIDSLGTTVISPGTYKRVSAFNDTLLWVRSYKDKLGVFDLSRHKEIIPCLYEWGISQGNNILFEKNKKIGIVNMENGQNVVPFIYEKNYEEIKNKAMRLFILETGGRKGVMTIDGTVKIPFEYDDITVSNDYLIIKNKGLFGLFDATSFQEILPIEFSKIDTYRLRVQKYENEEFIEGSFTREGMIKWF